MNPFTNECVLKITPGRRMGFSLFELFIKDTPIPASKSRAQTQRAFSLIELLVVISIISLLASMLMLGMQAVRTSVDQMHCRKNQSQMLVALRLYISDNRGILPGPHVHGTLNFNDATGQTTDGVGCKAGGDPRNGCPNTPFCNTANIHEAITWFGYNEQGDKNTQTLTGSHHISGGDRGGAIARETVTCPAVIRAYRGRLSLMQSGYSIGYPYNTNSGPGPALIAYDRPRRLVQISSPSRYVIFADGAVARWTIINGQDIMHMPVSLPRQDFSSRAFPPRANAQGIGANHRERAVVGFADGHVEAVPITDVMKDRTFIFDH